LQDIHARFTEKSEWRLLNCLLDERRDCFDRDVARDSNSRNLQACRFWTDMWIESLPEARSGLSASRGGSTEVLTSPG
jgi:hypothetical protein